MSAVRSPSLTAIARTAWFVLGRTHPSLPRMFLRLVVPLSLLPPVMLYYAGTYHGDDFMPGFAARDWVSIAFIFLIAELATVGAMGTVIRWVAKLNGHFADRTSAYLLAFAAPIPLWLSSLSLLVPNFIFAACLGMLAFGFSCLVIYHGVSALLKVKEDLVAGSIAFGIMACGLLAWAMLLIIVIPIA
ncbi:MAG TPA: YIP1 family protein [Rhodocyclaceae bacterium]|nr:YIP1 family protein [Rhodocyclaceae bacterium]